MHGYSVATSSSYPKQPKIWNTVIRGIGDYSLDLKWSVWERSGVFPLESFLDKNTQSAPLSSNIDMSCVCI